MAKSDQIRKEKIIGASIMVTAVVVLVLVILVGPMLKRAPNQLSPDNENKAQIPNELVMGTITKSDFDLSKYPDPNKVGMVSYESTLGLQELVNGYENYFAKNNWQIVKSQQVDDAYFMFANNASRNKNMQIVINSTKAGTNDPPFAVLMISKED